MSDQTISKDLPSAISSLVSVDGAAPSILHHGHMTDLFGQVHVPVSHSARQENKKVAPTIAISGPSGSGSSASAALLSSLENRLRVLFPTDGSIECILTWKLKVTPAGRQYCQLVPSMRPIEETGSGLWPTPTKTDALRCPSLEFTTKNITLNHAVLWATPKASDPDGGRTTKTKGGGNAHLPIQVRELWPTARASEAGPDFAKRDRSKTGMALPALAIETARITPPLDLWPTAASRDHKGGYVGGRIRNGKISMDTLDVAVQAASGTTTNGSSAPMEKRGASPQLSPRFVFWLMGYPSSWVHSVALGMIKAQKKR